MVARVEPLGGIFNLPKSKMAAMTMVWVYINFNPDDV